MVKAIKIILLLRHLQSPHFYYFLWDLFLWKSDQMIRDAWFCKVRCSKCDETMADISNFCIKCKTKLEIGRTVMKKAEDQVDNYNLVESWVLMVKSSKSRSQSWKRVPIVQICGGQRFVCKSLAQSNNIIFHIPMIWYSARLVCPIFSAITTPCGLGLGWPWSDTQVGTLR